MAKAASLAMRWSSAVVCIWVSFKGGYVAIRIAISIVVDANVYINTFPHLSPGHIFFI